MNLDGGQNKRESGDLILFCDGNVRNDAIAGAYTRVPRRIVYALYFVRKARSARGFVVSRIEIL